MKANQTIMTRKKCVEELGILGLGGLVTENMICGDPSNGNICEGDSGGNTHSTKNSFDYSLLISQNVVLDRCLLTTGSVWSKTRERRRANFPQMFSVFESVF